MATTITVITIAAAIMVVVLSYIAALVDARWSRGAAIAIIGVTAILLLSRWLGGPRPVAYGLTLTLSLFMAGIMAVNGVVRLVLKAIETRRP